MCIKILMLFYYKIALFALSAYMAHNLHMRYKALDQRSNETTLYYIAWTYTIHKTSKETVNAKPPEYPQRGKRTQLPTSPPFAKSPYLIIEYG